MIWLRELSAHPLATSAACVALAVVALVLRQLVRRSRLGNELNKSFSLIVLGLLAGAATLISRYEGATTMVAYLDALFFGALAIGVVRLALILFVDLYMRQREGAVISAIFRDVASVIAYFAVIVFVLRSTLDINLASLIATSAVLTAIVGLSLQDVLGNLFSGLVLEIEAPFQPGDWVRIGGFEGVVQETGWRTTKLRTRVNEVITLPNATLSKEPIINYTRPEPLFGDTLRFDAAYEAPPNVVSDAVMGVLGREPAVARHPVPEVRLEKFGDSGVGYAVRYWITDYGELERIRNRLHTNLWYALRRADVRIPFPARDLFVYPGTAPTLVEGEKIDLVPVLRRVPLFEPLDDAALAHLVARVRRAEFGRGETVVREGEAGDCFYVIEKGEADVLLANGGASRSLGRLEAGSFFGEMSLLAGERRSATVRASSDLTVLIVDRLIFKEIIESDPALLGPLSEIAARRQVEQDEQRALGPAAEEESHVQRVQRFRERIRAFFGLRREG